MNPTTKEMLEMLNNDPYISRKDKALIAILIQLNEYAVDQIVEGLSRRSARTDSEERPSVPPSSSLPC